MVYLVASAVFVWSMSNSDRLGVVKGTTLGIPLYESFCITDYFFFYLKMSSCSLNPRNRSNSRQAHAWLWRSSFARLKLDD